MGALRVARWCRRNVAALLPLLIGAVVACSYVSYDSYYRRFGVATDQLGLSYSEMALRQTSPLLIVCIGLPIVVWSVSITRLTDLQTEYDALKGDTSKVAQTRQGTLLRHGRLASVGLFLVAVVPVLLYVSLLAASAEGGGLTRRTPSILDPLRITVVPATMTEVETSTKRKVLVLRATESVLVVYDLKAESTVSLDPASVELSITP